MHWECIDHVQVYENKRTACGDNLEVLQSDLMKKWKSVQHLNFSNNVHHIETITHVDVVKPVVEDTASSVFAEALGEETLTTEDEIDTDTEETGFDEEEEEEFPEPDAPKDADPEHEPTATGDD